MMGLIILEKVNVIEIVFSIIICFVAFSNIYLGIT